MAGIQPEEFTQFVEQYKNLVYTICFSFCRNVFDAEDLTQETFLSAYRARESFDGAHEKAWLTAIAANKCRDYLKRPKQKRETLSPETLELLEDPAYRPEETFLAETENGRVTRLIQSLKEPYRVAILFGGQKAVRRGKTYRTKAENPANPALPGKKATC